MHNPANFLEDLIFALCIKSQFGGPIEQRSVGSCDCKRRLRDTPHATFCTLYGSDHPFDTPFNVEIQFQNYLSSIPTVTTCIWCHTEVHVRNQAVYRTAPAFLIVGLEWDTIGRHTHIILNDVCSFTFPGSAPVHYQLAAMVHTEPPHATVHVPTGHRQAWRLFAGQRTRTTEQTPNFSPSINLFGFSRMNQPSRQPHLSQQSLLN